MPSFCDIPTKDIIGHIDVQSIQAITVDTSVYEGLSFHFHSPPLDHIDVFLKKGVSYIITDVIEADVHRWEPLFLV